MQTVADVRGVGVKNREKFADVLCGRPLTTEQVCRRSGQLIAVIAQSKNSTIEGIEMA